MGTEQDTQPAATVRRVAAARGVAWITEGWALFLRAPGPWIVIVLLVGVILLLCNAVPVLGSLLTPFLSALLAAGVLLAARKLQGGGLMQVADLFSVLSHPSLTPLLIVAGIYLGLMLVAMLVIGAIGLGAGGTALLAALVSGDTSTLAGGLFGVAFALLLYAALTVPITAMYWFAIPAVLFQGAEPWSAMKQSLSACLANAVPLLLYGVIALVAVTVAAIPFFLGLLVVGPVLFASWLISYQDIYGSETTPPVA